MLTKEKPRTNTSQSNDEYESLKASIATIVGGNTDGRNLYFTVEVFDGEHNNRFETVWPVETEAEEVTDYLKSIIEKNPKLNGDIVGLMQRKIFWDQKENGWYSQMGNEKPVRMDKDDKKRIT